MKKWIIKEQDAELVGRLSKEAGISPFAAKLLINRGITNREQADEFFNGSEISPPMEIADMDKAVKIISSAIDSGDKITVYGDYDCDGVTATVILYGYLEAMGAEADWYIPSREEGYGLNVDAIDDIFESGTKLIVTVDNGISAAKEADYIKAKGMKLVITDHHQVPEILPAAEAIVNPHRSDDFSKCKELAGCGVALKLVMALESDIYSVLENWGDFAAIGTVADLVPLTGENRIIVRQGLQNLSVTENGGLHSLLRQCGIDEDDEVSSTTAAFTLCPRINAAGRFAHAKEAAELFLTDNPRMYDKMAENLTLLNMKRQDEEKKILEEIGDMISKNPRLIKSDVIVVSGDNWSHGVIGIVASRLLNKFGKPVIIITKEGELSRGSARSVEGFSLFKMLSELSDCLVKFGGHTKAAGLTLETAKIDEFIRRVGEYAGEKYPEMPKDICYAEMTVSPADLTLGNIESLSYFQPFGEANPSPVFHMPDCTFKSLRPLKDGKYVAITAEFGGREYKIINFRSTYEGFGYKAGDKADLLVTAEINEYNDNRSVALKIFDIRHSGFNQDRFFSAAAAYEKLCRGEEIPSALARRVIPDRKIQMAVYDIVRESGSISNCAAAAYSEGINYCMFRVALDLFESVGLMKLNLFEDKVETVKVEGKTDIENCTLMQRLKNRLGA